MPALRETPPELLRQLREVVPNAELLYMGEGRWWLGVVRPNRIRYRMGQNVLRAQRHRHVFPESNWPQVRFGLLLMQGFQLVAEYEVQGAPNWDGFILFDLRKRAYRLRNLRLDPMLKEHEDVSEGMAQQDAVRRAMRDKMMDLAPWAFARKVRRNPAPVTVPVRLI